MRIVDRVSIARRESALAPLPERTTLPPGPEQLNFDWIYAFVDPVPDAHAALQELLEQDPDQYLISNALWLGALPPAMGAPGLRPRRRVAVVAIERLALG